MEIAVLGTGCSKYKTLYERVKKIVEENQVSVKTKKIEDFAEISKFGVRSLSPQY